MTVLVVLESVVLAVLCVLVAGLLRAYGTVLQRLHRLDGGGEGPATSAAIDGSRDFSLLPVVSAPAATVAAPAEPLAEFGTAHDIVGETLDGELVSARVVGVDNDTLVLFLSSGCSSCETFWTELGRPGSIHLPPATRLLVVPQSPDDESLSDLVALAPAGVDVVLSSQAWSDYGVPGSPHVVYVHGATGRIRGEGTGQSLQQVAELLARSTGDAGFVAGDRARKPHRDAEQERAVDRELLAAGILPGDPRLYEFSSGDAHAGHEHD